MISTVTDPALAAILQRRRLLSEPQVEAAGWSNCSNDRSLHDGAAMVPSISPTVRPGFVQDALAAIQERLTFEPKSQPNVQCFDMATDSESEDSSDDETCHAERLNAQSSESTGDEDVLGSLMSQELGSFSGRPTCCNQAIEAIELCASQLLKVTGESTVGELRAAVNDQMSFNPVILTRASEVGVDQPAFLQLNDKDVIATVVGNVEDLVLRNVLVLDHGQSLSISPRSRLQILEEENADLKTQLRRLEERLAAAERNTKDDSIEEETTPILQPKNENGREDKLVSPGDSHLEHAEGQTTRGELEELAESLEPVSTGEAQSLAEPVEAQLDAKEAPQPKMLQEEPPAETPLDAAESVKDLHQPNIMPQPTPVVEQALPAKRKGTPLCVSLLSMQSPDQPAMKLDMTTKSTIAELRAQVMHAFEMDERTAKRLRFLRKRGACYVSFKEAECVREKIFLHDPDIRALSGLKLRSFSGVGGSRPTAEETSGLQHNLPAGVDDFMKEFILHTFARMNEEELNSWNALPKFVIWTMWFDILSSPFFRKCMEGRFREATFGPNFDRKASMRLAKDDPVLKEYAFHKRQLISVWFEEEEVKEAEAVEQAPEVPPQVACKVEKDHSDHGLFDFDDLDEAEMSTIR
mmetsp:Transcript_69749/g.110214  ORF Transcript_69749/g.110214 Transcript_69749/m.110214 type:complete len:638 (-) Transcript_69749:190-2103(-)